MVVFIAVHGGVSNQFVRTENLCLNAIENSNGSVVQAIKVMEDEGEFNCGYGSNLTRCGRVECEAAYSSSKGSIFGAIGSVSRIKNPIMAAEALAKMQQNDNIQDNLVPPCILVGIGAEDWAEINNIEICDPDSLISEKAVEYWNKAKNRLNDSSTDWKRMDTVGAVSIESDGTCHAGCSSGGILWKVSGRLGHTTQFGGAIWSEQRGERSVAVSLTGCGERIAKTCLAMKLADSLFLLDTENGLVEETILKLLEKDFMNSNWLIRMKRMHAFIGGIILFVDKESEFAVFICFHNTSQLDCAFAVIGGDTSKLHSVSTAGSFAIQVFPIPFHFK